MATQLTKEQLEGLRRIDSATVSNAIESFQLRPRVSGYAGYDIRCMFPELDAMVGYAVTCTADSTTEGRPNQGGVLRLWEVLEESPQPAVVVIKDVGKDRLHSCHMGEVMATTAKRLGAVGCLSDGGLRDSVAVRALGFQYFCAGLVVSHGNPVICDVGVEVELSGMRISPGDLLHGDEDGIVIVPHQAAGRIAEEATKIQEKERRLMDFVKRPDFTAKGLREYLAGFEH